MGDRVKHAMILMYLKYLRTLARMQLAKIRPTIIGITGSAGKTSLLTAIAAILKERSKVKISHEANSETGIPLNILGITPRDYSVADWIRMALVAPLKVATNWQRYDYYIVEMGIDRPDPPKNMDYLLTIIRPSIGVFLNALPVHSQYFDHLVPPAVSDPHERREQITQRIADEKGKLIEALPKNGTAILNLDDSRVRQFVGRTKARVVTFATQGSADLTASEVTVELRGFSMRVSDRRRSLRLSLPLLLPRHYAQTFLAAIAVGSACGISLRECVKFLLTNFSIPPGRMTVFRGKGGVTILDSSYNASPKTMEAALELLAEVAKGRRVAVLGDMRELGAISKGEHESLAVKVAKVADLVVTVGPMMRDWFAPKLLASGYPRHRLLSYSGPLQAAEAVPPLMRKGDVVLVKGSQNAIFLELVVEKLLKDPEDGKRLCRRGSFWNKQREKTLKMTPVG